jgi:hypothetical protein
MPPGTAQTLGEAARTGLADVARQAFTAGFHSAELAGAALLLALAVAGALLSSDHAGTGPAATADSRARGSSSS